MFETCGDGKQRALTAAVLGRPRDQIMSCDEISLSDHSLDFDAQPRKSLNHELGIFYEGLGTVRRAGIVLDTLDPPYRATASAGSRSLVARV